MSNPAKAIKKNLRKIVTIAAVVAIAYVALPALASAAGGGAAASTAATTAGTAGITTTAGITAGTPALAAAGTTAASTGGGGLLGAIGAGASKIGGAIAGADPIVQAGLISAGSQFIGGALTPEPQTEAERLQEQRAFYQSQPVQARDYSAIAGQPLGQQFVQAGQQEFTPIQQRTAQVQQPNAGLLGRYNPQTRRWEQA